MTKTEIVARLSRDKGIKKEVVLKIIDGFIESVKDCVYRDEPVEIRGFGTFYQIERKGRKVKSPLAKDEIDVPAKTKIGFRPSRLTERNK